MSAGTGSVSSKSGWRLAVRLAWRDLRGGLAGFRIFLACIALGVIAIVGVGSVSRSLSDGVSRESRRFLGGDASFALMHRELGQDERSWLEARAQLSTIATLRAMSRREDGTSALVEIKAVDSAYPVMGEVSLEPEMSLKAALEPRNGVFGIAADSTLSARLSLKTGDRILIGEKAFELRATLLAEPDKLAAGIGFGPRVLMLQDGLRESGLIMPGSLVRWVYRAILPEVNGNPATPAEADAFVELADKAFPDIGWESRTRQNVSPQFARNLGYVTQFLTLVGLTALMVGGVGVANAVRAFIERRNADFGTLKALGATGQWVFGSALLQVLLVTAMGIAIGVLIGGMIPFLVAGVLGSLLPFPLEPHVYPSQMLTGAAYGFLTATAFSLLPLGRAHDVPVSALFRDQVDPGVTRPRRRYVVATLIAASALMAAIIGFASERRLVVYYVIGTSLAFIGLRLISFAIMWAARRAPRSRITELRLAIGNIHRPGALTPAVVLSLGLGLALLVTLTMVDGNIRQQISNTLPGTTPSFFFVDIQNSQAQAFDAYVHDRAPEAKLERVPMMRGRFVRLNDTPAENIKASREAAWVLEGDRGITYATNLPDGSVLVEGAWWAGDHKGQPLVSVEADAARGLGIKVGDTITVNVLGRNITATVANLRKVNWRSLGINFVFVFSPNTFVGAPHTHLATAAFPAGTPAEREISLLKDVANTFPAVTTVRVKDALEALNSVMDQLAFAIRAAASIAIAASVLVLAGALAAGQNARIYDSVILKTLGATRMRLLTALVIEYSLLGVATAIFGILAGGAAAAFIVTRIMRLEGFVWVWGSAFGAASTALLVTVGLGLLGTWRVLGQKPARRLRSL